MLSLRITVYCAKLAIADTPQMDVSDKCEQLIIHTMMNPDGL